MIASAVLMDRVYERKISSQLRFCKIYLETVYKLYFVFYCENPNAIWFKTRFREDPTMKHKCSETLIDSTLKTNSSNLEMFCIQRTVFRVEFPIAHLLL